MYQQNNINVLLIDDNERQADIIINTLKSSIVNEVNVFWHKSGRTALDFLNTKGSPVISLILLEIEISDSSGDELVIQIKNESSPHKIIPVIIFSNTKNLSLITHYFTLGINSWVRKPSEPDMLQETINLIHDFWFEHVILPSTLT
ncbi:MAG: response regulator [Candidatus Hodarchaeota archaeon]